MFKKVLPVLLVVVCFMFSCVNFDNVLDNLDTVDSAFSMPDRTSSVQRKSSHMVIFYTGKMKDGLCTATAVGPHSILTAEHCFDDDTEVTIDLSRDHRHITNVTSDGREHLIVDIDGPEFKNYIDLESNTRVAKPGEPVYIYGSGGMTYPPRKLEGKEVNGFDSNSDVDQAAHIEQFTMGVIPGDSGSAIYGSDGKIVGLVTYGYHGTCVGFALDFNATKINVPLKTTKKETIFRFGSDR